MTASLGISAFTSHGLRESVLNEVHARPFTPLTQPVSVIRFAFMATGDSASADRDSLAAFCARHGVPAPEPGIKHHQVVIGPARLRWEQHSEFATFTWIWSPPAEAPRRPFGEIAPELQALIGSMKLSGELLVAVKLGVESVTDPVKRAEALFDKSSLALVAVKGSIGALASDFRLDEDGFTRILVCIEGPTPERLGALVQRVLELETYRTLALLGLPVALELSPQVDRIERRLVEVLAEMQGAQSFKLNNHLLRELTELEALLERGAIGSLFRFGASRAYYDLVQSRLAVIEGEPIAPYSSWSSFLARRTAPAMRTCNAVEGRQSNLSRKLARAADLLRTRVNVELEQQNRDLLRSMNERTKLQLRLQSTVEGLSVAAIGYYVVSLFGYLAKGAHDTGLPVEPTLATAAFVPVAIALIWFTTHQIRKRHLKEDHEAEKAESE
ncbi:membrane protein [Bradyrhizobium sp. SSBR45G]|uniref:DUF3422 domain-containing protein n=1 Tax=unclassified Bradyrhizobium TaxID=2631580 RepID=UPI002342A803|nr:MULTISPECIES: DUF3422 domain-containing protein [unclassified Bradyrhizobium]GLH76789.1 membrane protein [Bradyrhizobium sp. SSBR45G]GLH83547.1 membrane protein [Bradyrhizobium sp. SSBR45R]